MGNSTEIDLTASNPAHSVTQTHRISVFDPSLFSSRMELTPQGILSTQTPFNLPGLILQLDASTLAEPIKVSLLLGRIHRAMDITSTNTAESQKLKSAVNWPVRKWFILMDIPSSILI